MAQAMIRVMKARKTPRGWVHPQTRAHLGGPEFGELFVVCADTPKGDQIVSFVVQRTALEQIGASVQRALHSDPVSIRRA